MHDPVSYLLDDNDVYLYVHHLPADQYFAIKHILHIDAGSQEIDIEIGANGNQYYNKAIFERHRTGEHYIKFGKVFEIIYAYDEQNIKFKVNFYTNWIFVRGIA